MPSLHGSTHEVSVKWDSEDWLSILTPTLLLNFFTQLEPVEQESRNEQSTTTAPESSQTKPTRTRYGASRLEGTSESNKPIVQPVQQPLPRSKEELHLHGINDIEGMTIDELKERLFQLSANPDENSREIRRLHRLIGLMNDFRLVPAQKDENLQTVSTQSPNLNEVAHIDFSGDVSQADAMEPVEHQPPPTKSSIESSLEKHGLIEDGWLRNTLISTLEDTEFGQLPYVLMNRT